MSAGSRIIGLRRFIPIASGCNNTAANPACQLVTFGAEVDSFTTVDFTYRADLPWQTQLTLSAFNIFDQDPPAARLEPSYDPFIGSPIGRSFKIGLTTSF